MVAILLGILMGFGVAIQTVINTRLRIYVGSPLLASTVSFTVGSVLLALALFILGEPIFPEFHCVVASPWWFWIGGLLGAFWISANILVFQQLGAVQTAIFPIFGQVVMGVMIDHFGWFNVLAKPVTMVQLLGVVLVLTGIVIAVAWQSIQQLLFKRERISHMDEPPAMGAWKWRLFALIGGAMIASQSAINTQLSHLLDSSVQASFISFFVGMVALLLILLIKERQVSGLKLAMGKPWWIWIGGVLGAGFVVMSVILVPWIGVGQMLVLILLGLLLGSFCVDSWGWFGVTRKPIRAFQWVGMIILVSGVFLIRLT